MNDLLKTTAQKALLIKKAIELNPQFDPVKDFGPDLENEVKKWMDVFNPYPETQNNSSSIPSKTLQLLGGYRGVSSEASEQASALPQFLKQLLSKDENKSILTTPEQKATKNLHNFGSDTPFAKGETVAIPGINESETADKQRGYESQVQTDPFGNKYLSSPKTGKPDINALYSTDPTLIKTFDDYVKKNNETKISTENAVLRDALKTVPATENNEAAVYRIVRTIPAKSAETLLAEENAKLAAFNMTPYQTMPNWIREEAKNSKPKTITSLVMKDKKTGDAFLITSDPDTTVNPPLHSTDVMQRSFPELFEGKPLTENKKFEPYLELLNSGRTQADIVNSAPREVLKKLGLPTPTETNSTIHSVTKNGKTYQIDPNVAQSLTPAQQELIQTVPPETPKKEEGIRSLSIIKQAEALPEYIKFMVTGKNPNIKDLGADMKVPTGLERKVILQRLDMGVAPSLVSIVGDRRQGEETYVGFDKGLTTKALPPQDISHIGSGSIVGKNLVLTARHVTDLSTGRDVKTSDGKLHKIVDVYTDPNNDFSLLKVEGLEEYKPVKLGDSNALKQRDFVIGMGFPATQDRSEPKLKSNQGLTSALDMPILSLLKGKPIQPIIKSSTIFEPGQSGGALLNKRGELIGIISADLNGDGYSVPINVIKKKIEEMNK